MSQATLVTTAWKVGVLALIAFALAGEDLAQTQIPGALGYSPTVSAP